MRSFSVGSSHLLHERTFFFNDKEHITFVLRNCWGNDWIHTNQNLQQSWRRASITVLRGSTFSPLHWDMFISLWFYGALWFHLYLQCLLRPIGTCWSVWGENAQPKQEDWGGGPNGHRCQRYRGHVQCGGPSLACLVLSRIAREVTRTSAIGTPSGWGGGPMTTQVPTINQFIIVLILEGIVKSVVGRSTTC